MMKQPCSAKQCVLLVAIAALLCIQHASYAEGFMFGNPMKHNFGGYRQRQPSDSLWQRQRQRQQMQQQQQQRRSVEQKQLSFQDVGDSYLLEVPTRYPQGYSTYITRYGKLAVESRADNLHREWVLPDGVTRDDITVDRSKIGVFAVSVAKPITSKVSELDDKWQIVIGSEDPDKRTNFDIFTQRNSIVVRNRRRNYVKEWTLPGGVGHEHISLEYLDDSITINILKPGSLRPLKFNEEKKTPRPTVDGSSHYRIPRRVQKKKQATLAPTRDDLLFLNTDQDLEVYDDGDWFSCVLEPKDETAVSGYIDPRGDFVSY